MTTPPPRRTPFRAGGTDTGAAAAAALAVPETTAPKVLLADISEFQADLADAAYLAWSKAIVIRAAYGSQHDDAAWYGGQRRDLLHVGGARFIGIYQYLVAGQSGTEQAQALRRIVGDLLPGEVLIADFEEGARPRLTEWYNAMHTLYGPAVYPYLWTYSGANFAQAQSILPVDWIAAYGQAEPSSPHTLWQFTDAFPVPGVGACDCSVYHGTIDQLAALAWQGTPAPPAQWTYGPPRSLTATGGHTSVSLTWLPPAGAPEPPAGYQVYVYRGTVADRASLVASYPRTVTSAPFEGGSLERGQGYIAHVVAAGPGGTRVAPGVYASAAFRTG
jgi:hypothetical protein